MTLKHILTILIFFTFVSLVGQNIVDNGDFENGMGGWNPWFVDEHASWAEPPTADAEFSIITPGLNGSEKAFYIKVNKPGKSDWYILVAKGVPMRQGTMYEISLRATSDVKKTIGIGVHEDISSGSPFFFQPIADPFQFLLEYFNLFIGAPLKGGERFRDERIDAEHDLVQALFIFCLVKIGMFYLFG